MERLGDSDATSEVAAMAKTVAELKKLLACETRARQAAEEFSKAEGQRAERAERVQSDMAREIARLRERLEQAEAELKSRG
jgi:hypothetical protein